MEEIDVTISLYFKAKNAEIFEGVGGIGYMQADYDFKTEDLSNINLEVIAKDAIEGYAKFLKIPEKNICVISREEYEKNAEE